MTLLVDTSVWSLAFRRDGEQRAAQVAALITQLCIRHDLILLTMDGDVASAATHYDLKVWKPAIALE